jgi:hypothetical protein
MNLPGLPPGPLAALIAGILIMVAPKASQLRDRPLSHRNRNSRVGTRFLMALWTGQVIEGKDRLR